MSVRMRSFALTGAAITSLALALPTASAVAEPNPPGNAPSPDHALARAVSDRLARTATVVPRPDGESPDRLPKAALGATPRLSAKQQADAKASSLAAGAGSGLVSASTDTGTWHFEYDDGFWSPSFAEGELNSTWSPGGDRYVWGSADGGTWVDRLTDPWTGDTLEYTSDLLQPAPHGAISWSSIGDSWLSHVQPFKEAPGAYSTRSSTPRIATHHLAEPGYGPPVTHPLGGEAYAKVVLSKTSSDIVSWPHSDSEPVEDPVPTRLGYDAYRPGNPALAQAAPEALGGAGPTDFLSPTNLAFLGVDPADPTLGHLYVDHNENPQITPEPVADFTAHPECDLPAPAFSPDRRTIWFVTAEGETEAPCDRTALRSLTAGSNGRFNASDATETLRWWSEFGAPYRTLSVRDDTIPVVDAYRFSGRNRYEVGVETSWSFYDDESADAVVVAGGLAYADALAGGPLATSMGGPVLLTYPNALHSGVAAEIDRVLAPGGTVYITGGTASVSNAVQAALTKPGRTVKRLAGSNRYAVAVAIAKEMDQLRGGVPGSAFVAGGTAFADALVAGPAAAHEDGPILLSNGDLLPAATLSYLDSIDDDADFRVYGIGGAGSRAVASRPNDVPVTGRSRFDVARAVADHFFTGEHFSGVADGRNWPDAVSGGAAMAAMGMPIMLTNGDVLPVQTAGRISQSAAAVDAVLGFGGPASIPDGALLDAADLAGTQTPLWGPDALP